MSGRFPQPRHVAFGADLLTGLVIVAVAVAAGRLTWRLAGSEGAAMVDRAAPAGGSVRAATDLAPIFAYPAFGNASASSAPATSLGLVLRGILRAEPASASAAMIAVGTAPARAFLIGQSVSGATIEAIEPDRVLLRAGGRLEALAFPRSPAAAPPVPATPAVPIAPPILVPPAPPASLVAMLGATPTGQGYRIGDQPPAALARAGLMPGDVIERINDVPVGDPDKDRAMIANASGGPVRVTLSRGGRRVTLTASLP